MKKKFIAKLLVLCMLVSALSVSAFAVNGTDTGIDKWTEDQPGTYTYKLTSDVSISPITLSGNSTYVIDLDTKTLKTETVFVKTGTNLTIQNGNLYATNIDTNIITVNVDGALTLDGVYVATGDTLVITGTGALTKKNVTGNVTDLRNVGNPGANVPSGGGSIGGGVGGSNTSTVVNPDGSTTTIVEDANTGAVAETTDYTDGTKKVVVTQKDGSSKTTFNKPDGTTSSTNVAADGKTESEVTLPSSVVDAAGDKTVVLPLPELSVGISTVTVKAAGDKKLSVAIPVNSDSAGVVAVIVGADGSEQIVTTSVNTKDGLELTVSGTTKVKIMDNSKAFTDVKETDWANNAVAFVSARGIMNGTDATIFDQNEATTRAMVWTMLARLNGQNTEGGATWYEKGMDWAKENGVSDGTDPNGAITREQLAVMLWRYMGSPEPTGDLGTFNDANTVSDYAMKGLAWASENGVVNGMGDGVLNPGGNAIRSHVAQMFMNFISNIDL